MNCGTIAVMMGIILSIIGNFLSTSQKHKRQNSEHNKPRPISGTCWELDI